MGASSWTPPVSGCRHRTPQQPLRLRLKHGYSAHPVVEARALRHPTPESCLLRPPSPLQRKPRFPHSSLTHSGRLATLVEEVHRVLDAEDIFVGGQFAGSAADRA